MGLGTRDALLILSHHLQFASDRDMEKRLVQFNFSAALDRVSHRSLLYKQIFIGVGGQFFSIVFEFLSKEARAFGW